MALPFPEALEVATLRLIQHARDRCGAGFGNYPTGVRYAITELLLLGVDQSYREKNGLGESGKTIAESVADLDARLAR